MPEMKKCEACGQEKLCKDYGGGVGWQWLCEECTTAQINRLARRPIAKAEPPMTAELALINKALDTGRSAEEMVALTGLVRRMQEDKARTAFHAAMSRCQADMPAVVRDKDNKGTGKKYAPLETILPLCKPIWLRHGFSITFSTAESHLAGHHRVTAEVLHEDGHSKQYQIDLPADGTTGGGNANKNMNAVQGVVSTTTYGQRDLVIMAFNIVVADRDVDGQGGYVTPDQIGKINDLLEECRKAGKPVVFADFLAWLNVESLDKLPQTRFELALYELKRKRGQRKEPMPC